MTDISLREKKKHGLNGYCFAVYENEQRYDKLFVTNHWHDEIEIIYIKKGEIKINIGDKNFFGEKEDIFLINKGEMHEIQGGDGEIFYYALVFGTELFEFSNDDDVQRQFILPIKSGELVFSNTPKIPGYLLERLIEINRKKSEAYMMMSKAVILNIISDMINRGEYKKSRLPKKDALENLKKEIISYINDNISEHIALEEISRRFHMSPKYFCRFFKNNFYKTFIEYLNGVRIERAKELLLEGKNVTEAALCCGFFNMSYFTRVFKEITDMTPSQYRRGLDKTAKPVIEKTPKAFPLFSRTLPPDLL